jgi:regulator of RNase E activity RraB
MSFLDIFRSTKKPDVDESVLSRLRKAGSNLSKLHNIEFFLYFPYRDTAEKAAIVLRNAGFEVSVERAAQGDAWLCLATKTMIPEPAELQRIRFEFVALAASMNGEYDGWGTGVVK